MSKTDPAHTEQEFHDLVNMTPAALEKWLETEDSKSVGWGKDESGESVGHKSGERIVEILRKKKAEITDDDRHHMGRVVSYIKRHMAQTPDTDNLADTNWTKSLKNWGHDPTK